MKHGYMDKDASKMESYIYIILLPVLGMIMERIVKKHMEYVLEYNKFNKDI